MTASSGILFALATTLSWSICVFPFTEAAKRLGANPLNHFRLLLASVLIMALAILSDPICFRLLFTEDRLHAWLWLGFSGILGLTIGDHFGFGMYTILGARLGSVLTTFAPGAALAVGMVLTGDRLSLIGLFGMVITITGVITISLSRKERNAIPESRHGSLAKGVIFGLLAAFCQGAGLVLAKRGMSTGDLDVTDISAIQATFI
ncbi:MAG: EamA family transporter, partial [Flavobacteriales bacterium]